MTMYKKTKIICTIADNNCDYEFLKDLREKGMNIVRINSAHASIEGASRIVENTRKVSKDIAILIDTKGPEIRLGTTINKEGLYFNTGDVVKIANDSVKTCTNEILYTSYSKIVEAVPVGASILIDDGCINLEVIDKDNTSLTCKVMNTCVIKSHKSINIPNVDIDLPAITDKDKKFIIWAIEQNLDFIAHSFVRNAKDLITIQNILDEHNSHIKLIAKIENQQGIDNIDEILDNTYGVMIARGDLGVEIPSARIPIVQKELVEICRTRRRPVIVATQMLQSMIDNLHPSRAELTDISNAIQQGTDAIMLSGETTYGKYPVQAVATMTSVAHETEEITKMHLDLELKKVMKPVAAVITRSLIENTSRLPIKAVIFDTYTGRVGRYLSSFRPKVPLYAMCYNDYTIRELSLVYGVESYQFKQVAGKEEFAEYALNLLKNEKKLEKGDLVGFVGGVFGAELGATYMELRYVE